MTHEILRRLILSFLVLGLLAPLASAAAAASESDPEAVQVAQRLLEALGGEEAWNDTHYITFDFFGRRSHVWDKHTGRHRLEGETQEGERYVVLHDVDDRGEGPGRVFVNGEEASGDAKAEYLKNAYAAWINDTYWLAMPYKLLDPGVTLAYEGRETIDGTSYDVVKLSFDDVGLTPGDRYWAYVNRDTGLMDRWAYHLQSMEPDAEPTAWDWVGWKRHGNVMLSPTREQVGGDRVLSLAPIEVPETVPDATFTQP